jgi:hypothetical protein
MSMQDAAVWATTSAWSSDAPALTATFVACTDGYVCLDGGDVSAFEALGTEVGGQRTSHSTRDALVAAAHHAGIAAAPVCTVSEAATSPQAAARKLILEQATADGRTWPLLNSPLRLLRTGAVVQRAIGELGEANEELRRLLGRQTAKQSPVTAPRPRVAGGS